MTIQIERGPVNDDPKFKNNCKGFWFDFCVILKGQKMTTCLFPVVFIEYIKYSNTPKIDMLDILLVNNESKPHV